MSGEVRKRRGRTENEVLVVGFIERNLTRRRVLVLKYYRLGWPVDVIAAKLHVCPRTVWRDLRAIVQQDPHAFERRKKESAWMRMGEAELERLEREPDQPAVQAEAVKEPAPGAVPSFTPRPFAPRRMVGPMTGRLSS